METQLAVECVRLKLFLCLEEGAKFTSGRAWWRQEVKFQHRHPQHKLTLGNQWYDFMETRFWIVEDSCNRNMPQSWHSYWTCSVRPPHQKNQRFFRQLVLHLMLKKTCFLELWKAFSFVKSIVFFLFPWPLVGICRWLQSNMVTYLDTCQAACLATICNNLAAFNNVLVDSECVVIVVTLHTPQVVHSGGSYIPCNNFCTCQRPRNSVYTTNATIIRHMFSYRSIKLRSTPTADSTTETDKKWCWGFRSQL